MNVPRSEAPASLLALIVARAVKATTTSTASCPSFIRRTSGVLPSISASMAFSWLLSSGKRPVAMMASTNGVAFPFAGVFTGIASIMDFNSIAT